MGNKLGKGPEDVDKALAKAKETLDNFRETIRKRGQEILKNLRSDEMAFVIIGKTLCPV